MHREDLTANVCLILDLEGYFVRKQFYARELGWCDWEGRFGVLHYQQPYRWKTLNSVDRHTAIYVYHRIHGLPFEDPPEENARPLDNLKGDVLELYEQSRTPERFLVAYKGGHVEKNLLRELDLPPPTWNMPDVPNLSAWRSTLFKTVGSIRHEDIVPW